MKFKILKIVGNITFTSIYLILIMVLCGCAAKIKQKRYNEELNRYEIKPSINTEPWIALRKNDRTIVTDSLEYSNIIQKATEIKKQKNIDARFKIEKQITRVDKYSGKESYYAAVGFFKMDQPDKALYVFKDAIQLDSLLFYKSDVLLWISQCYRKLGHEDSSSYYYRMYCSNSESNIFPGFNHYKADESKLAIKLKDSTSSIDSILSLESYHTNIYERPSFIHRPYYPGSNTKPDEKGTLHAGAYYSSDVKFLGLFGLSFSPIGIFTPTAVIGLGKLLQYYSVGTYIKHFDSKYNNYSSKFFTQISYNRREINKRDYGYWQPMVGYEINYFPIECIGTFAASYLYLYNQWNKHETVYSDRKITMWHENRAKFGVSFFLYDQINITGQLMNLSPEGFIDFGYIQIGFRKDGFFVDYLNFYLKN